MRKYLALKQQRKKNIWLLCSVDYGLAKPYIDTETNKHIAYSEHRSITGNRKTSKQGQETETVLLKE